MSIKIQNIKNNRTFDIDSEAKLHYHYLDPLEQKRLLFSNMRNGKIDQDRMFEMSYEFMELMLTGWEGILDEDNDKPIIFKKELIKIIPLEIAIDFVVKAVIPSFEGLIKSAEKIMPKDEDGKPIKIKQSPEGN